MCLSMSIFFAIKEAIGAARKEVGLEGSFRLDSPATAERIRLACVDEFTKQVCYSNNFVSLLHFGSLNVSLILFFYFLQVLGLNILLIWVHIIYLIKDFETFDEFL